MDQAEKEREQVKAFRAAMEHVTPRQEANVGKLMTKGYASFDTPMEMSLPNLVHTLAILDELVNGEPTFPMSAVDPPELARAFVVKRIKPKDGDDVVDAQKATLLEAIAETYESQNWRDSVSPVRDAGRKSARLSAKDLEDMQDAADEAAKEREAEEGAKNKKAVAVASPQPKQQQGPAPQVGFGAPPALTKDQRAKLPKELSAHGANIMAQQNLVNLWKSLTPTEIEQLGFSVRDCVILRDAIAKHGKSQQPKEREKKCRDCKKPVSVCSCLATEEEQEEAREAMATARAKPKTRKERREDRSREHKRSKQARSDDSSSEPNDSSTSSSSSSSESIADNGSGDESEDDVQHFLTIEVALDPTKWPDVLPAQEERLRAKLDARYRDLTQPTHVDALQLLNLFITTVMENSAIFDSGAFIIAVKKVIKRLELGKMSAEGYDAEVVKEIAKAFDNEDLPEWIRQVHKRGHAALRSKPRHSYEGNSGGYGNGKKGKKNNNNNKRKDKGDNKDGKKTNKKREQESP